MKNFLSGKSKLLSLLKRNIIEMKEDRISLEEKILRYSGENPILKKLSLIVLSGGRLNDEQLKSAEQELKIELEKPNHHLTIKDFTNPIKKIVRDEGEKTYVNIKLSDKKSLLFKTPDYEFNFPDDDWVQQNKNSLEQLNQLLSTEDKKRIVSVKINGDWVKKTLQKHIDDFYSWIVEKNPILNSIVKNEGGKKIRTSLGKLDTNVVNWSKWILKLDLKHKLGTGSPTEKIINFFKERPIQEILERNDDDEVRLHIKRIESENNIKFLMLSFAEYELMKDALSNYQQTLSSIKFTSDKGDTQENEFIGNLLEFSDDNSSKKRIRRNDIVSFSTPGNIVDLYFGIDLLVNLIDNQNIERWVPIQVKSDKESARKAMLLYHKIGGISIFRSGRLWLYFNGMNDQPLYFSRDFIYDLKKLRYGSNN